MKYTYMEIDNVYDQPEYESIQKKLESDLLDWYLKTSDTVPIERNGRGFDESVRKKLNDSYEKTNS